MNKAKYTIYGVCGLAVAACLLSAVGGYWLASAPAREPAAASVSALQAPTVDEHEHEHEHEHEQGVVADGEHDEHGDSVLPLTPAQLQAAGIALDQVQPSQPQTVRVYSQVVAQSDAQRSLSTAVDAVLERWLVTAGSRVRLNQPLADLSSATAASWQAQATAQAIALRAAEQLAGQNKQLFDAGIIARQEWQQSEAALATQRAELAAQRARLAALPSLNARGQWQLLSPADGVLLAQRAAAGSALAAGAEVASWGDPARRQLSFTLPAEYAATVSNGLQLQPRVGTWRASVSTIAPVDGQLQLWALPSAGELPPLGSAQEAELLLAPAPNDAAVVTVPQVAVQQLQGQAVVFVVEPTRVRAQPVLVGAASGARRQILRGLQLGQRIATDNAFLLKAELAKGEAEHDH